MNLKDCFSKIYVINLPERTDRRFEVEKMLVRVGIDLNSVHFFPGIRPKEAGGFRSIGAHGCFLSHLKILEEAAKENLESILIIEDDLEIIPKFLKIQSQIIQSLNSQKWEIVYFGHQLALKKNGSEFNFEPYQEPILLTHFLGFKGRIIPDLSQFLQGLLKEPPGSPKGGPMDVDGAYTTFRLRHPAIITLVANPSLGYQRSSRGDIAPAKWFDRPGFFRYFSAKLRKIKQLIKKFV